MGIFQLHSVREKKKTLSEASGKKKKLKSSSFVEKVVVSDGHSLDSVELYVNTVIIYYWFFTFKTRFERIQSIYVIIEWIVLLL